MKLKMEKLILHKANAAPDIRTSKLSMLENVTFQAQDHSFVYFLNSIQTKVRFLVFLPINNSRF